MSSNRKSQIANRKSAIRNPQSTGRRRFSLYGALALLLCVFAIGPYLAPGYFWGAHDARHDVYFLFEYDRSVQDGIWFPRWSPDFTFGYGYPFFIIYGPLASFVGELLHHFLGLGWTAAVEVVFALSIIASALAMYGFVRSWLGRAAGLVAAVAYVYVPYHLVNLYVRAALAESVAMVFLPLVLWGARSAVRRPRLSSVVGLALAYAGLMVTNNLVTLIFTPVMAAYLLLLALAELNDDQPLRELSRQSILPLLANMTRIALPVVLALLLGFGLSAAFALPALSEARFVNQEQWYGGYYDPFAHFVYPHQLFSPAWGFGISQPGPDDIAEGALSYQLGIVPVALAVVSLLVAARTRRAAVRRELVFFQALAVALILLTLPISAWAWRHLPLIGYAQFPWRYLMLVTIPLSVLAGSVAHSIPQSAIRNPQSLLPALVLAALLILGSSPYLRVEVREPTPEQGPVSYAALMRFQRTSDEMTGVTAWVDPERRPHWSAMAENYVQGRPVTTKVDYSKVPQNETLAVHSLELGSAHEKVWFHAGDDRQRILFNRFWFPGWRAWLLDGENGRPVRELPVEREEGPLARIVVPLPQGEGYLLLRFEDTPVRRLGKAITGVSLLLLGVMVVASLFSRVVTEANRPGD
ncbi:MAG: hypothetical protein QHJ81_08215 [Anaerolineae bacterium]|nr:hypothetical protein [Anaerolineae bacterium]